MFLPMTSRNYRQICGMINDDKKPELSLFLIYFADEKQELSTKLLDDFNDKKQESSMIFGYGFLQMKGLNYREICGMILMIKN